MARHSAEATVYLGRQPIYGVNRDIRAYELLYRCGAGDTTARFHDADQASAGVLLKAFLEIRLPTVSPLRPNSALHRRRSEIRSPAQAVMMLGMDIVSRWATLLVLADNDDCPAGYLEAALQRARMSELIGASLSCSAQDAYITGLLSTLDSVFNEPLVGLVEPLPIDIRFKRALLQREGALGAVLDCVLAYESGEWTPCGRAPSAEHMQKAFWDAAEYAHEMISQMVRAAGS